MQTNGVAKVDVKEWRDNLWFAGKAENGKTRCRIYKASHDGRQEDESSLHIGQNGKLVNQKHSGIFGPPQ